MAAEISEVIVAAQSALQEAEADLDLIRERQLRTVVRKTATGSGNLDASFALDRRYRLVFIRCHFTGAAGTAAITLSTDCGAGSAYDTRLFTITQAGVNKDVHLRIGDGDAQEPSAWTFQPGDALRLQWTNPSPGSITWGLEVGLASAY